MTTTIKKQNTTTAARPGYKHTPLGWIPEEWGPLKRFDKIIVEARLGGNYENESVESGIPVVKMGNIGRGTIVTDELMYLPVNTAYDDDDVLCLGDLLLNTRNTLDLVGKVAVWKNELPFALYNSNLLRMKFDSEQVASNEFMNYALNSYNSLKQLRRIATGTTSVAAIYNKDLKHLKFPLPPLPEQRKIAAILSTWDDAIQTTQALIAQLQLRNKGLAQQLLTGKKRLKGFEGEWVKLHSDKIFKSVSKKNNNDEELLSVTQDRGAIPRTMLEGRVTMPDGSTKGYKLVEKGDFIISLRSFQGGLEYSEYRGIVSPAYTVLKPIKKISDNYYKYYFKSYDFIGHLAVAVIGIRDGKQISFDDFCTLKLPYPEVKEQQAIAAVLDKADEELKAQQAYLAALQQQKKGLMQQLLTGAVRVKTEKE